MSNTIIKQFLFNEKNNQSVPQSGRRQFLAGYRRRLCTLCWHHHYHNYHYLEQFLIVVLQLLHINDPSMF